MLSTSYAARRRRLWRRGLFCAGRGAGAFRTAGLVAGTPSVAHIHPIAGVSSHAQGEADYEEYRRQYDIKKAADAEANFRKIEPLLKTDFGCAFTGAALYAVFINYLIETLEIPIEVVGTQLAANLLYGIFGLTIFLTKRGGLFPLLVQLNFFYSAACFFTSLMLLIVGSPKGATLLVIEGFFVLTLAQFERARLREA